MPQECAAVTQPTGDPGCEKADRVWLEIDRKSYMKS